MEWNSKAEIFIIFVYIVIPALLIIIVLIVLIVLLRNLIKSKKRVIIKMRGPVLRYSS